MVSVAYCMSCQFNKRPKGCRDLSYFGVTIRTAYVFHPCLHVKYNKLAMPWMCVLVSPENDINILPYGATEIALDRSACISRHRDACRKRGVIFFSCEVAETRISCSEVTGHR